MHVNVKLPAGWDIWFRQQKFREIERRVTKDANGCWLMPGIGGSNGYASICVQQQHWPAHRFMWALVHEEIPEGLFVCHHCDVRMCVCPEHLFVGTHAENMADAVKKGRHGGFYKRGFTNPKPPPPKQVRGLIMHEGRQTTIRDLAKETGVPLDRLRQRYYVRHMRGADLVAPKMATGPKTWRRGIERVQALSLREKPSAG